MCGVRCAVAATQRAVRVQMCGCWLLEGGCGCTVAPVVDRHGSSLAPARGWADTPSSLFCISAAERAGRPGQQLPGALGACRHSSSSSSSQLSGNSGAAEPRASPLDPPKMSENNKKKVKEKNGQPASQARGQALISTATHPHPRSAHSPTHLTSSAAPPPPPRLLMRRRRGRRRRRRLLLLLPCLAAVASEFQPEGAAACRPLTGGPRAPIRPPVRRAKRQRRGGNGRACRTRSGRDRGESAHTIRSLRALVATRWSLAPQRCHVFHEPKPAKPKPRSQSRANMLALLVCN